MIMFVGGVPIYMPNPIVPRKPSTGTLATHSSSLDYSKLERNPHEITPAQIGVHLKDNKHE